MTWQAEWAQAEREDVAAYAKGLLNANKLGSGFRAPKDVLGTIGQGIAEAITGGHPKSFHLEPPLPTILRVDIYLPETDSAVEVKTGGSKVKGYQLWGYQKALFSGGFSVMFVQNPFNGEIGPDVGDYIELQQRSVPYTQVWFAKAQHGKL
jgi:hypothetical protein